MTRIPSWLLLIFPGVLVVLSGAAISAQDKYALQVPGGLAFSEFRGYEGWPVIAISLTLTCPLLWVKRASLMCG
jgi:hypothetical protein